jgi:hypothetical protein
MGETEEIGVIRADDPRFVDVLDLRIAAMRRLLRAMTPESPSAALTALRGAFPEAPLAERVRALSDMPH